MERWNLDGAAALDFPKPHVKWASMTGDGLQDIVVVYDSSIEY